MTTSLGVNVRRKIQIQGEWWQFEQKQKKKKKKKKKIEMKIEDKVLQTCCF